VLPDRVAANLRVASSRPLWHISSAETPESSRTNENQAAGGLFLAIDYVPQRVLHHRGELIYNNEGASVRLLGPVAGERIEGAAGRRGSFRRAERLPDSRLADESLVGHHVANG